MSRKKNPNRHIIWSNIGLDLEDWRDDFEEQYPGYSDEQLTLIMEEINGDYLDDERCNLDICFSQPILVIADLGLWDGRRKGYFEIDSGNIKDCLHTGNDIDYAEWYVDQHGDLRADGIHHDGTNHYLYRVYKEDAGWDEREELKDKLFEGTAARSDIERVTESLGEPIGRVYGWPFSKEPEPVNAERGER